MSRLVTTIAALAVAGLMACAVTAAAVAPPKPPLTTAKVVECLRGDTVANPEATFRGSMRRTLAAQRMGMKFTLQEKVVRTPRTRRGVARQAATTWHAIKAPGLGVWRMSRSGVRMFAYRQNVQALAPDSAYRVVIAYRWYDSDGVVVKNAKRRSTACRPAGLPSGS